MNLNLIIVGLVLAVSGGLVQAQFSPLFPGFGLGFPGMPFFPTFFGRVYPPYIPQIRPGLMTRGRLFMGGKRDVDSQMLNETTTTVNGTVVGESEGKNVTVETTPVVPAPVGGVEEHMVPVVKSGRTVCNVSSTTGMLNCTGTSTIECDVVTQMRTLDNLKLRIFNLVPRMDAGDVVLWKQLNATEVREFTFVHPTSHANESLYIFTDEKQTERAGFFVRDSACFARFVALIKDEGVRLTLAVN